MAIRPFGITVLSILTLILGVLLLFGGLMIAAASVIMSITPKLAEDVAKTVSQLPGMPVPIHSMMGVEIFIAAIGIVILIVSLVTLLVGWGLWTGRNWTRWIAIIYFGLGALSSLSNVLEGRFGSIISLVINGLIVYYLFTPHVKKFFSAAI